MSKKNKLFPIDLDTWLEEVKEVKPYDRSKISASVSPKHIKYKANLENPILPKADSCLPGKFFPLKMNNKSDIDERTRKKMDSGEIAIDAILDLHNQTLDGAFSLLVQFIDQCFKLSKRMLLVITGKGNRSGESLTTIKKEFLVWVNEPHIRNKIIRFSQAHRKHGGGGAFYILLKRNKLQKK